MSEEHHMEPERKPEDKGQKQRARQRLMMLLWSFFFFLHRDRNGGSSSLRCRSSSASSLKVDCHLQWYASHLKLLERTSYISSCFCGITALRNMERKPSLAVNWHSFQVRSLTFYLHLTRISDIYADLREIIPESRHIVSSLVYTRGS